MWESAEVGSRHAASDVGMLGEEEAGGGADVSAFAFISRFDAARLSMAMALVRATDPCLLRPGAAPCAMVEDAAGKTSIEADSDGGGSARAWHGRRRLYEGMQEEMLDGLGVYVVADGREARKPRAGFGVAVGRSAWTCVRICRGSCGMHAARAVQLCSCAAGVQRCDFFLKKNIWAVLLLSRH